MFEDFNRYLNFLVDNVITANQFLLCYLLYLDRKARENNEEIHGSESGYTLLYKYIHHCGIYDKDKETNVAFSPRDIHNLEVRGFITNNNKKGESFADYLELTDKFMNIFSNSYKDFDQFWDTYPGFIENFVNRSGPLITLKSVVKEELEVLYYKRIKTKIAHKKMMGVLIWAIENNKINMSIKNFIGGEVWKDLESIMNKEKSTDDISTLLN